MLLFCPVGVLLWLLSLQLRSIGMVGYVLGPFIFAACMFGMVMQVRLPLPLLHRSTSRVCAATQLPKLPALTLQACPAWAMHPAAQLASPATAAHCY
jgi:hypothetical protein